MNARSGVGQSIKIVLFIVGMIVPIHSAAQLSTIYGDFRIDFWGLYRPESFVARNFNFLNNCNNTDQVVLSRHTLDFRLDILYGKIAKYKYPAVEFNFTARNRAVWGNPSSIASTTDAESSLLDIVGKPHRHFIPRHFFWMREGWLRFSLNQVAAVPFTYEHTFMIGAFPFQLGRGISLGDAYAVTPEYLGFYTEIVVDQYAFGAKFSGDLWDNHLLSYDLYTAVLSNLSDNLTNTCAKIRGQEFGRFEHPVRGFGRINFLCAGRLMWTVLDSSVLGSLVFEPYCLYNNDPEQKVQFLGDASSRLGTLGLAGEYEGSCFAIGFDSAVNIGHQSVRGWDRNQINVHNRDANPVLVNSHVVIGVDPNADDAPANLTPYLVPHAPTLIDPVGTIVPFGREAQKLINEGPRTAQFNGKMIGSVPGFTDAMPGTIPAPVDPTLKDQLFNTKHRFRDPYMNTYKGAMFVMDAAAFFCDKELAIAGTFGWATGDNNPNDVIKDCDFNGFIGLQEIYSGKRVRSAYVLGGAGKLKRPLSVPTDIQAPSQFARSVFGFTDLIFIGSSAKWDPTGFRRQFSIQPNILVYWKDNVVCKFDAFTRKELPECARNFLGVEVNLFTHVYLVDSLKLFFVGSVFVPGCHFTDRLGIPLDREQDEALAHFNRSGAPRDRVPNLGHDTAYTLNLGLEFKF